LTDHAASARPTRNATKHTANTEWLRLAPKYCQKAGAPRIVRRKKQRNHQEEPRDACWPNQDADHQPQPNGKFTICREESERRGVRQNKTAEHRNHEGINPSLEKLVDPELESAVKREFRAEDFVLTENQKENTDGNAQYRKGVSVARAGIGPRVIEISNLCGRFCASSMRPGDEKGKSGRRVPACEFFP